MIYLLLNSNYQTIHRILEWKEMSCQLWIISSIIFHFDHFSGRVAKRLLGCSFWNSKICVFSLYFKKNYSSLVLDWSERQFNHVILACGKPILTSFTMFLIFIRLNNQLMNQEKKIEGDHWFYIKFLHESTISFKYLFILFYLYKNIIYRLSPHVICSVLKTAKHFCFDCLL